MNIEVLSKAIRTRNVLQFRYTGDAKPGLRVVEPHMLAYNEKNNLALSGWLQMGVSGSGGRGWREYLINAMSEIVILEETFAGPRPGYRADGGKSFHAILCCL